MVKRKIVHIDEEKCNGCGACANACHENAIVMVNGKARLLSDDYCDGLGACLPACPADAIRIIEREADAYDEEKVRARQIEMKVVPIPEKSAGSCPGTLSRGLYGISATASQTEAAPVFSGCPGADARDLQKRGPGVITQKSEVPAAVPASGRPVSRLAQWPVQIQLAPVRAAYFDKAKLLVAADCAAYSYAAFHEEFMKGHVTLIGCPKLDPVDYTEKLSAIIAGNDIKSVTIVRMEVPCCGGLERYAREALQKSGKFIPWQVITLSLDGEVLDD